MARWVWLASTLLALGPAAWSSAAAPARAGRVELAGRRSALYADYAEQLAELADWCDRQGLDEAARFTRRWQPERDPLKLYVFVLPPTFDPPAALAAWPQWWARLRALREQQAERLFELAATAQADGHLAEAFELAREAVRENPDHAPGRAVLGYERYTPPPEPGKPQSPARWERPATIRRLQAGQLWHERFGWLAARDVHRYERGERRVGARWLSADEAQKQHSDIRRGWQIDSEHFTVTTNDRLEAGVELARRLERLHDVWSTVFATFGLSPLELQRRFEERATPRRSAPPNQVVYYRNRDEYVAALRAIQPQIEITLGIFLDQNRTAYFFAGEPQDSGTLWHEATHQLFHTARPGVREVAVEHNFWVREAVACYMESLAAHGDVNDPLAGGYYTLGGWSEGRLPAASVRLLRDNFYVPLAELTALGRDALQRDARLPRLYSQSAGLAAFLMHYEQGKYRAALVDYLRAVYSGRADAQTLARACQASYDQLDREYRQFMQQAARGAPVGAPIAE